MYLGKSGVLRGEDHRIKGHCRDPLLQRADKPMKSILTGAALAVRLNTAVRHSWSPLGYFKTDLALNEPSFFISQTADAFLTLAMSILRIVFSAELGCDDRVMVG